MASENSTGLQNFTDPVVLQKSTALQNSVGVDIVSQNCFG